MYSLFLYSVENIFERNGFRTNFWQLLTSMDFRKYLRVEICDSIALPDTFDMGCRMGSLQFSVSIHAIAITIYTSFIGTQFWQKG